MKKRKPISIIVLSIFAFVCSLIAFFFCLVALSIDLNPPGLIWKVIGIIVPSGWLLIGITGLLSGIGILGLKPWGRKTLLFVTSLLIVFMCAVLIWINPSDAVLFSVSLLLPVVSFVYFLNRSQTKELFK